MGMAFLVIFAFYRYLLLLNKETSTKNERQVMFTTGASMMLDKEILLNIKRME